MTIKCKICDKEFEKQITNSHLKTHSITTNEYKSIHGVNSLSSEEYRNILSEKRRGEKNSNYGNKWSADLREAVSKKATMSHENGTRTPWNKGITVTDETHLQKIRYAIEKRENKYESGELVRHSTVHSEETKNLLSLRQKEYAKENPELMSARAKKARETKLSNGYFEQQHKETLESYSKKCNEFGFITDSFINNDLCILTCKACNNSHVRSIFSKIHDNMCKTCSLVGFSSYEAAIREELSKYVNTPIYTGDKTILNPLELDLYLPDYNLAIEINGLYWHSEKCGKNKWYHKYKTDKCKEKNITLIHIFEDEWIEKKEIVINRILSKLKLNKTSYARKYTVKEVDLKIARSFLNDHHIQGYGANSVYHYGLYDTENNLKAVMTFSTLSIAKGSKHIEGNFELNRFASIGNIVGGASKLFAYFIKMVNPTKIISYADLRWNTGNLYEKLGFTFTGNTMPNYFYVKGTSRIHRFKLRKQEHEPKDISEKILREQQGYYRIWDCGSSKWVWEK
jgi:hypothetical protein